MRRALLLVLLAGCTSRPDESLDEIAAMAQPLSAHERVLDVSPDGRGALVGVARPVPADADPMLVLDVVWRRPDRAQPLPWPLRDARFVAADRAVIVDPDSRLLLADLARGTTQLLDAPVAAGLDFASACRCVAYMRGESPETAPAIVRLDTFETRTLDGEFAPAWLPALAPDGQSLVLTSARTGVPAIWRLPLDGGAAAQLTNVGAADPLRLAPFPEGVDRPVHTGDLVLFRFRGAVVATGLDGTVRWTKDALGAPRRVGDRVGFDGARGSFSSDALRRGPP